MGFVKLIRVDSDGGFSGVGLIVLHFGVFTLPITPFFLVFGSRLLLLLMFKKGCWLVVEYNT